MSRLSKTFSQFLAIMAKTHLIFYLLIQTSFGSIVVDLQDVANQIKIPISIQNGFSICVRFNWHGPYQKGLMFSSEDATLALTFTQA